MRRPIIKKRLQIDNKTKSARSRAFLLPPSDFLKEDSAHGRGLHGGPETRGPRTRTGSGLYFKRSAGSGSGPNLLLRVPGLFNFVCNTRVDRRTPHPPEISVSQHACV